MGLIGRDPQPDVLRGAGAQPAPSCDIAVYNAISGVPAAWDTVAGGSSLFLGRGYLRLLEAHGPPGLLSRYALIMRNGVPVAAVRALIFDVDDGMLAVRDRTEFNAWQRPWGRFLDKGMTWLRNRSLGAFGRRIVLCGNLFSCGLHGVAFANGEDPQQLWPAVVDALHRIRDADGQAAYLLIKDFMQPDAGHCRPLLDHGFARLQIEPSMDLAVPASWHTHADYCDSLNAKHRKAMRKIYEAVDRFGAVVESGVDPQPEQDRLFELYLQVEHHAQIRFGMLQAGYLPALADMAGPDRFRCSVIRKGGGIIGFSTVLKDGDTANAHVLGFDYAANAQAPVYLRLLHQTIEDSLALGCRTIHYGRTALEPKSRLGATPTDTEIWVKHCQPFVNRVVGRLLRLVPEDTSPRHQPFRLDRPVVRKSPSGSDRPLS